MFAAAFGYHPAPHAWLSDRFAYTNLPDLGMSAQHWLTVGRGNLGPFPSTSLTSPAFDAAIGKVTWTEGAPGAAPDLTTTAILVTRNKQWHWEIVAPYRRGEIRFPHLPTDTFDWNPASEDVVDAEQVMNAEVPGGYDAVRSHILDIRDRSVQGPAVAGQPDLSPFVDGNAGRVVLVQSLPQLQRLRRARVR